MVEFIKDRPEGVTGAVEQAISQHYGLDDQYFHEQKETRIVARGV